MPRKSNTTPPLVPGLPGEHTVDSQLVEATVERINRIYATKGLETARSIGEALLSTFFDGEQEVFEQRAASHHSFRAVAEHDQLRVSHSFLWYSVRLVPQLQALPHDIAHALPLSHHRLLLHVKDEDAKAQLAHRAVEQGMGKRELDLEIRRLRNGQGNNGQGKSPRRGRKPLPAFVKAFNQVQKAVHTIDPDAFEEQELRAFGIDQARDYLAGVEQALDQLARVRAQLAERVAALAEP